MNGGPVYLVEKRRRHRRGEAVVVMRSEVAVSEGRACGLMQLHRGTREGWQVNHKRVHRLHVEEKLGFTLAH
ncbi:MAG TPA: hypothetical protein VF840_10735 [Terriglobales bacterium]